MEKQYLDLMQFFEGYVRNYRRMNLSSDHNRSMFTKREIDYFANLGEMLGFDAFVEDSKIDKERKRSRPMDLSLWKWDSRKDVENYSYLSLHLERENQWNKDEDTIDKLFSETEEGFIPHNVIGIQFVESIERIKYLNELVVKRNKHQNSNTLMIYRFYDTELAIGRVRAYNFTPTGLVETRYAICKEDEMGYWFMCFEEEFAPIEEINKMDEKSRLEKSIITFLEEKGIDTVNKLNLFNIFHVKPKSEIEMRQVNSEIRNEFQTNVGVYIYIDSNCTVLYVGIGKLGERVRFHYYESFGKFSGKNCEKHIKFFTQHQGEIKILWIVENNRIRQRHIEDLLTKFLSPKYEEMKKAKLLS